VISPEGDWGTTCEALNPTLTSWLCNYYRSPPQAVAQDEVGEQDEQVDVVDKQDEVDTKAASEGCISGQLVQAAGGDGAGRGVRGAGPSAGRARSQTGTRSGGQP
jgi:hypothetical protein